MANKGKQAFLDFTAGLLSRITDPTQRATAEASIRALEAIEPAAQAFGDGIAGQAEIDRQLQDLRTRTEELDTRDTQLNDWRTQLSDWYAGAQEKVNLAMRNAGKPAVPAPTPAPAAAALPADVMTEAAYKDHIAQERAAVLGLVNAQQQVTRDHFSRFNEIVDLQPLLQHPQVGQIGLVGVYELVHKDRLAAHAATATKATEDRLRAEGAQAERERLSSMPYPTPTGAGSGSPLDGLSGSKSDSLVAAATAEYNRLQAERGGSPAR